MGLFDKAKETSDRIAARETFTRLLAESEKPAEEKAAPAAEIPVDTSRRLRFEFVIARVRAEDVDVLGRHVRTVVDTAAARNATTQTILGNLVFCHFAYPLTHSPTEERVGLAQAFITALAADVAVVHGVDTCTVATYGGRGRRVHGPMTDKLPMWLKRLAEMNWGLAVEVS